MEESNEKKLIDIIRSLDVPKNRYNEFGGFNYRSAEDIITALKPKLHAAGLLPICTFRVEERAGHPYQVARVFVVGEGGDTPIGNLVCEGWSREDDKRTKMDAPQLSGSAASYAEKRAWGGYLGLNDEQDSDALNVGNGKSAPKFSYRIEEFANKDLRDAIVQEFRGLNREEKVNALNFMQKEMLDETIKLPDYSNATELALMPYLTLFLEAIHNQEANKTREAIMESGVSIDDAKKIFKDTHGQEPAIVNHTSLDKEDSKKGKKKTKYVKPDTNLD